MARFRRKTSRVVKPKPVDLKEWKTRDLAAEKRRIEGKLHRWYQKSDQPLTFLPAWQVRKGLELDYRLRQIVAELGRRKTATKGD